MNNLLVTGSQADNRRFGLCVCMYIPYSCVMSFFCVVLSVFACQKCVCVPAKPDWHAAGAPTQEGGIGVGIRCVVGYIKRSDGKKMNFVVVCSP